MRVLYLTQYFNLPDEAGSSRHYQFARAWAAAGHEVEILTGNVNYKTGRTVPCDRGRTYSTEQHPDGFRIKRLWVYSKFQGSFRKRLLFFGSFAAHAACLGATVRRPDVVFASSTPLSIGLPGLFLARRFRVPFVFEVRDLWPEAPVAAGVMKNPRIIARTRQLAQFLYARADHLVAVTEGIRDGVLSYGMDASRVTLVPNGVDHWMEPDRFAGNDPVAAFHDRFLCVYVGAHGIWNDLDTLLAGAESLRDDPTVRLVFIGDGDHRPALEARARASGLNNVTFLGALPKEEAFAALCHADLALVSASGHEHNRQTLPNKIFDYMAAGVPVVVAAGPGEMAALIERSGGGWTTPAEDGPALAATIRRVRDLPAGERKGAGVRGRAYVLEHYFRPALAARVERIFRALGGAENPSDAGAEDARAAHSSREREA